LSRIIVLDTDQGWKEVILATADILAQCWNVLFLVIGFYMCILDFCSCTLLFLKAKFTYGKQ